MTSKTYFVVTLVFIKACFLHIPCYIFSSYGVGHQNTPYSWSCRGILSNCTISQKVFFCSNEAQEGELLCFLHLPHSSFFTSKCQTDYQISDRHSPMQGPDRFRGMNNTRLSPLPLLALAGIEHQRETSVDCSHQHPAPH